MSFPLRNGIKKFSQKILLLFKSFNNVSSLSVHVVQLNFLNKKALEIFAAQLGKFKNRKKISFQDFRLYSSRGKGPGIPYSWHQETENSFIFFKWISLRISVLSGEKNYLRFLQVFLDLRIYNSWNWSSKECRECLSHTLINLQTLKFLSLTFENASSQGVKSLANDLGTQKS